MKRIFPLLFLLLLWGETFSQRTEMSVRLNSGLSRFSGESAINSTFMFYNIIQEDGHTNSPYGSQFGIVYGASLTAARITENQFRFGAELGYEMLGSTADIKSVYLHGTSQNANINAEGDVSLNSNFINLFPNAGYRFLFPHGHWDLTAGLEVAYCLDITEEASATTDLREFETKLDRKTIDWDLRPRIQAGITYKNFGAYAGFSKGLVNYRSAIAGSENKAFNDIIRLGLIYEWRLKGEDYLKFRYRR